MKQGPVIQASLSEFFIHDKFSLRGWRRSAAQCYKKALWVWTKNNQTSILMPMKLGSLDRQVQGNGTNCISGGTGFPMEQENMKKRLSELELRLAELESINNILKEQLKELSILYRFIQDVSYTLESGQLVKSLKSILQTHFMVTEFSIVLYDSKTGLLHIEHAVGLSKQKLKEVFYRPSEGLVGRVFQTKKPIYLPNAQRVKGYRYYFQAQARGSILILPLTLADGHTLGVLKLRNPLIDAFSETDQQLLGLLSRHLAVALYNCRLVKRLDKDSLLDGDTELPNERMFLNLFHREMGRAQRFHHPLSLVSVRFQLTHLRNGKNGRRIPLKPVRQIAEIIQQPLRSIDVCARLRADCFVALLPETNLIGRSRVEQKLSAALEALYNRYLDEGYDWELTFSVQGVTFPDEGIEPSLLLERMLASPSKNRSATSV